LSATDPLQLPGEKVAQYYIVDRAQKSKGIIDQQFFNGFQATNSGASEPMAMLSGVFVSILNS
jgi:hypothetical protein